MKVDIKPDGTISITAENPTEAFALLELTQRDCCELCGTPPLPVVFDLSVIAEFIGHPVNPEDDTRPD